jgi:ATP-dependent Clp protease ATP-binding subunit ClpA
LNIARINDIVGRSEDMQKIISRLMDHNVRLITVVGKPGIGKTSITSSVAFYLQERYRFQDGILYIALSKLY